MAEYQVNIAELQEICDYVINADYPYFEELREAFKLLRHTGCREMEIFEIERWSQISGDEFTLTPQKGNNNRTIILGEDFLNFKAAILGQYPPFLGRTYSQLQNLFKRVCPYWPIYSGGKQITLYTFRYLFLHELKADGLTNQQIADIMGHVNVETVSNYLDAVLSSENEVPTDPFLQLPAGREIILPVTLNFDGETDNFQTTLDTSGGNYTLALSVFYTNQDNAAILDTFDSGKKLPGLRFWLRYHTNYSRYQAYPNNLTRPPYHHSSLVSYWTPTARKTFILTKDFYFDEVNGVKRKFETETLKIDDNVPASRTWNSNVNFMEECTNYLVGAYSADSINKQYFWKGDIYGFVFWPRILSLAEQEQTQSILANL